MFGGERQTGVVIKPFNEIILLMRVWGIWPLDEDASAKWQVMLHNIYRVCPFFILVTCASSLAVQVFVDSDDMDEFSEVFTMCLTTSVIVAKWSTITFNTSKLKSLMTSMEVNLLRLVDGTRGEGMEIIQSSFNHANKLLAIYLSYFFITSLMYVADGTTKVFAVSGENATAGRGDPRPKLLRAYYPQMFTTEMIYVMQFLSAVYNSMISCTIDVLYIFMMIALKAQFKMLMVKLRGLTERQEHDPDKVEISENTLLKNVSETKTGTSVISTRNTASRKVLTQCVMFHQDIFGCCKEIDVFSTALFIHFLTVSVTLCFCSYRISQLTASLKMTAIVAFMLSIVVQLGIICWYANDLADESLKVCDVAYDTPWYTLPASCKFCIQAMIMRAQKPVALKAGYFGVISKELFAGLLQTSYSYFAVLKQTQMS